MKRRSLLACAGMSLALPSSAAQDSTVDGDSFSGAFRHDFLNMMDDVTMEEREAERHDPRAKAWNCDEKRLWARLNLDKADYEALYPTPAFMLRHYR